MNINIKVDLRDYNVQNQLEPRITEAVRSSLETSLAMVQDRWQQTAQQKLHSTIPLYLMGLDFKSIIYPYQGDPFTGAVELHGKFPNMLETGFAAFDEKIGFSKSPHITPKKDGGWYLTIPIRHSTPGAFMYGNAMPKDVYGVAKKLGNNQSLSSKDLYGVNQTAKGKSWNGYQHKSNIYDGLTRIIKSYQNTKQSQYMTFRRVSDKSDPLSWQHPGFVGVKIAKSLEPFATDTFTKLIEYNLNNM